MKFLNWLNGKKTVIGGAISIVTNYLLVDDIVSVNLGMMISGLSLLIFGIGVTHKVIKKISEN